MALLILRAAHLLLGLLAAGFAALGLALLCRPSYAPWGLATLAVAVIAAAGARMISRDRPPFAWALP